MSSRKISFSAHADAKGILEMVYQVSPKNIVLVHGEKQKMNFLKNKIQEDLKLNCYCPANGETLYIKSQDDIKLNISTKFLKREQNQKEF